MNRFSSLSVLVVAASIVSFAVGCAAPASEETDNESIGVQSEAQTREHILLARQVGATADTTDTITSGSGETRCGDGSVCTETSTGGCDGFRDKCNAQSGCGTTSAGNAGITVVSCIAIPPRPTR